MATTYTRLIRSAAARWLHGRPQANAATTAQIRALVSAHGRLPIQIDQIDDDTNLYAAGLRSFAAVQLMVAIEDTFDLNIERFHDLDSIGAISEHISKTAKPIKE